MNQKDIDRFWNKVETKGKDECWEWQGALNSGYGWFRLDYKSVRAHVISWELTNGTMHNLILHKCDNKACCNPNHLYNGTYSDNAKDREQRNPMDRSVVCGNNHGVLTAEEIKSIRELKVVIGSGGRYKYKYPTSYVAKLFKIDPSTIGKLWNSDIWLCKEGYYV